MHALGRVVAGTNLDIKSFSLPSQFKLIDDY